MIHKKGQLMIVMVMPLSIKTLDLEGVGPVKEEGSMDLLDSLICLVIFLKI